jgi:transcriptional regulator with XRE-family HTH domain
MSQETIAERIRAAREERNITQKALAGLVNKTAANISDIERTNVHVNADDLELIAQALQKPIEYFFNEVLGESEIEKVIYLLRQQSEEAQQQSAEFINAWLAVDNLKQNIIPNVQKGVV